MDGICNNWRFGFIIAAALAVCFGLVREVNRQVAEPYMDEIFHARQFVRYYEGDWFTWDPKLTTPPGLYLISILLLYFFVHLPIRFLSIFNVVLSRLPFIRWSFLHDYSIDYYWRLFSVSPLRFTRLSTSAPLLIPPLSGASSATSVPLLRLSDAIVILRCVNGLVFFPLFVYVCWCLLRHLHFGRQSISDLRFNFSPSQHFWLGLRTARIATMPTHFFFFFLYYTDGLSTLLVLTSYYFMTTAVSDLHGSMWFSRGMILSGVCGGLSILVRQTNVVWTGAIAGVALWRLDPSPDFRVIPRLLYSVFPFDVLRIPWTSQSNYQTKGVATSAVAGKKKSPTVIARNRYGLVWVGLHVVWPQTLSVCVFAFWVVFLNGGHIVLGHTEYHVAVVHWAQVVYLSAFLLLVAWPFTWNAVSNVWLSKGRNMGGGRMAACCAAACCAGSLLCMYSSRDIVHPFLLADNRHYMFYIWKRLLQHQVVRLLVVPICTGFFVGTILVYFGSTRAVGPCCTVVPHWCCCSESPIGETSKTKGREHSQASNALVSMGHASFPIGTFAKQRHVDPVDDVAWATGVAHASLLAIGSLICVVPAELLEVRYWTMSALFLLLHLPAEPGQRFRGYSEDLWSQGLATELLCLVAHTFVNVLVFYVFLYCPFATEEGNELSRFMY
eukprot:GHVS01076162.1.p1 GENE.GHVS01076162.1~~GHVS01076162.1.p1  ORF type:complete len:667 (+),score=10.63 GHVS01076162.1:302-2302(+)